MASTCRRTLPLRRGKLMLFTPPAGLRSTVPPGWPACLRPTAPPGLASSPPATRSAPARCAPPDRSRGSLTRSGHRPWAGPRGTIFRPGHRSHPGQRPGPGRRHREQPCSCPAQLDRDRPMPTRRTPRTRTHTRPHTRPARGPQRSHRTEPQGHERSHATRSKDKDRGPSRCLSAAEPRRVGGALASRCGCRVLRSRVLAPPSNRSSWGDQNGAMTCPRCGGAVPRRPGPGRPRVWCSSQCRSAASSKAQRARAQPPPAMTDVELIALMNRRSPFAVQL